MRCWVAQRKLSCLYQFEQKCPNSCNSSTGLCVEAAGTDRRQRSRGCRQIEHIRTYGGALMGPMNYWRPGTKASHDSLLFCNFFCMACVRPASEADLCYMIQYEHSNLASISNKRWKVVDLRRISTLLGWLAVFFSLILKIVMKKHLSMTEGS